MFLNYRLLKNCPLKWERPFNRTFRHEVLDAYLFDSLQEVRDITSEWIIDYNEERPHDALNGMAPTIYREKISAGNSTLEMST